MKIPIVLTSHARTGDAGHETGAWMEEPATPRHAFVDAAVAEAGARSAC